MTFDLTYRVAQRYLESGFIPAKWFSTKKKELKVILALPVEPEGAWWVLRDRLLPFFDKFGKELIQMGMHDYAETSVLERVDLAKNITEKIIKSYEDLASVLRGPWPPATLEADVAWYIRHILDRFLTLKIKTVEDAINAVWRTDVNLVEGLAKKILKKAVPKEYQALKDEFEKNDAWHEVNSRIKYSFYDRINIEASAKRLLKREKVEFDYLKWIDRTYDTLAANYTQENLEKVDGFRELSIGNMKVIIVDPKINLFENNWYIRRLVKARALLRKKGFDDLWYGVLFIISKEANKLRPDEVESYKQLGYKDLESQAGTYHSGEDIVKIYAPSDSNLPLIVAHELGHRYWYRRMKPEQRARFNALVKTNPSEKVRDLPSGPTEDGIEKPISPVSEYGWSNIGEAFAMAFEHYIMGKDMNRDQIESFRSVLASIQPSAEQVVMRFGNAYRQ